MVDIVDKATRSRMMSGIRSANTRPEVLTRQALHRLGYRFRLNTKIDRIKPDIVLRRHKIALFVHGCYWHQHRGCKLAYADRQYSEKWQQKFSDNKARDKRVTEQLLSQGWRVVVFWECATRKHGIFEEEINRLHDWIQNIDNVFYESKYKDALVGGNR